MTAVSRRRFLAGVGGLGLLAAGCGNTEAAAPTRTGPADLRLWTHDPSYVATFRAAIADPAIMAGSPFTPALEVTAATGDDLVTRTMTQAIANGTPPDLLGLIISVFPRVMKSRIAENLFLDLTDTVAPFGADLLRAAPYTVDGRLYALDSDTCISVLYYREDEYARAGIPADLGSWDELIEAGGRLHAATGQSVNLVSNGDNTSLFNTYLQFLLQRGGGPFNERGELTIDTDESAEALDLMRRGVANGAFLQLSDPYGGAAAAALKSGQLVSVSMPSWYNVYGLQANAPEQAGRWRMRTLPRFSGGGHIASSLGGTGFAVSATTPNREAALDLLRRVYLTPAGQLLRFRTGGFLPTLRSLYDAPEFLDHRDEFLGGQESFREFAAASTDLPELYQDATMPQLADAFGDQILAVYRGDIGPAEAIRGAVAAYTQQVRSR
ncbi:extracellular solute-binding protein [Actinomycetes bacterium KLBMP 9759]